jgi:hypothetical protein
LPARLGAGLAQMSSKQAFFTGLAVGVSSTGLGALIVANRQRLANLLRGNQPRQAIPMMGQNRSAGQPVRPKPIPGLAEGKTKTAAGRGRNKAKPIPALAATTRLKAAPIQMQTGDGQPFLAENGYRVVRPDGSDTGLAITPYLEQGGEGKQPVERPKCWGVTHTGTGALVDGPYDSLEQAQGLATKLAPLPWTTGTAMPKADMTRVKRLIKAYRQALAGEA